MSPSTDAPSEPGPRALVVIPTYDERDNLEPIVARVLASVPAAHVLVVDDGSPDGTGGLADAMASADPRVHVLHRTQKAGLGAAYVAGFSRGMAEGYETFVEMDADGSHAPEQLPALLAALDGPPGADVVLGSRWVAGGRVVNWPRRRVLLSRGGNLYARLALGVRVKDATGGYRAYRRSALQSIDFSTVTSQGYCFQVDLAWRALQAGLTVVEVPIVFTEREHGQSKMTGSIVKEALWRVTVWGAERRWARLRALRRPAGGSRLTPGDTSR